VPSLSSYFICSNDVFSLHWAASLQGFATKFIKGCFLSLNVGSLSDLLHIIHALFQEELKMFVKILYFCLSMFVLQTGVWCAGPLDGDRSDFWEQLRRNIGTPNNPDLAEHFNTIIDTYKNARVTPESINKCLDLGSTDSRRRFIEALHTIANSYNSYKDTDPNAECPDLFRYLYIAASAVFEKLDIEDSSFLGHASFLKKLKFYFSRTNPDPTDGRDYDLTSNFKTFMACQLYLSQLLTNPEDLRRAPYKEEFDYFLKELTIDPISDIIKYLSTYRTPYYRHVLSPVEGMANLFPDYVPLVVPISLTAEDIFDNLPNETNRLWFVGLALSVVEADGYLMTPPQFFLHDLFHITVYAQNTHLLKLNLRFSWEMKECSVLDDQRRALYEAQKLARNWIDEATGEERTLRLFVSFYLFHESRFPISIGDVFRKKYDDKDKLSNLLAKNLSDPTYYRNLLPEYLKRIFYGTYTVSSGHTLSTDQQLEAKENIMKPKVCELCQYISENTELTEDEKERLQPSFGIDFYDRLAYRKIDGDDTETPYLDPSYNLACLFFGSQNLRHVLLPFGERGILTSEQKAYVDSLKRSTRESAGTTHPPASGAGAGAGAGISNSSSTI
jgi:hypothetical protein